MGEQNRNQVGVSGVQSAKNRNQRGSLLLVARFGPLRNKAYRSKFRETETLCFGWGVETEATRHLILEYKGIKPVLLGEKFNLVGAMSFDGEQGRAEFGKITRSKQRLGHGRRIPGKMQYSIWTNMEIIVVSLMVTFPPVKL